MGYSYQIREMSASEMQLQKEYCFHEDRIKTLLRIAGEQIILWLFLMLVVYAVLAMIYSPIKTATYIVMLTLYVIISGLFAVFRYCKEKKVVLAMEKQSKPVFEEFSKGKVESCAFQIIAAGKLEENEDEGPTFVLDVGEHNLIVLCEHGKIRDNSFTPGDTVKVVRLPESKRVIATYWSGSPVKISKTIEAKYLNCLCSDWMEGDIIKGASAK